MRFVDIHTHILFNIDDGSESLAMSLDMLDAAYRSGTRAVFFTPHCAESQFDFSKANSAILELEPHIKSKYENLLIYGGCEVMYNTLTAEGVLNQKIPTLANSQYILVEFDPLIFFSDILDAVRNLTINGFFPIIAHAERYGSLNPNTVSELVDTGAYIQINAGSVLGKNGTFFKKLCLNLLKAGLVHFIASDCHDLQERPPMLDECAKFIEKKYGTDGAERLFYKNALKIINNDII